MPTKSVSEEAACLVPVAKPVGNVPGIVREHSAADCDKSGIVQRSNDRSACFEAFDEVRAGEESAQEDDGPGEVRQKLYEVYRGHDPGVRKPDLVLAWCSGCGSEDLEHAALGRVRFEADSNTSKGPRHSLLTDLKNTSNGERNEELEELVLGSGECWEIHCGGWVG